MAPIRVSVIIEMVINKEGKMSDENIKPEISDEALAAYVPEQEESA